MATVKYLLNDAFADVDPVTAGDLVNTGLWVDTHVYTAADKAPVLTAGAVDADGVVHLSWTDAGAGVTRYVVRKRLVGQDYVRTVYTGLNKSVDADLGQGWWNVTVYAEGTNFPLGHTATSAPVSVKIGVGALSSSDTAPLQPIPQAPPDPVLTLVSSDAHDAILSWTADPDPQAEYDVRASTYHANSFSSVLKTADNTNVAVSLALGVWEVKVVTSSSSYPTGKSGPSNVVKVTIAAAQQPAAAPAPTPPKRPKPRPKQGA